MSAQAVSYPGAPAEPAPAADLRSLGTLHRVHDAAEGYVFLAASDDFAGLATALAPYVDITRAQDDANATISVLTSMFATKSAMAWEQELLPQGVGCVAVNTVSIESIMFDPAFGRASGYISDAVHPTVDEHPRPAPYIRFSRSPTQALAGVLAGQHTDLILARLGNTDDEISDLRDRHIVA